MKNTTTASLVIALAALSAGQAMAADSSASAIRDNMRAGADLVDTTTGVKYSDLFPALYGKVSTKTRAQVAAELAQAQNAHNTGDVVDTTTGVKYSDLFPALYGNVSTKTRAQVVAELEQYQSTRNAGDLLDTTTGVKYRDLFPSLYNGKAYN
jgi:hypothetical protein